MNQPARFSSTGPGTQDHSEATAYHEAGHAVLAMVLGRIVDRVTVVPDENRAGLCAFRKGNSRRSEDWLEREMLIALGGIAAEARHTGDYAWDSAAHDSLYVRGLAVQRAGQRRAERLERRLLAKVEHILSQEENWRAVELIAAELLRLGTISGRAARHLFEQSGEA